MGDEDQVSQHQTRVLLVNGQTVILQGNPGDNAINEINADILQQALQEASAITETPVPEDTPVAYPANDAPQAEQPAADNLLAIFSGDQGETHTIRLTVEQAEALGLHFTVDSEENDDLGTNDENKTAISDTSISNQQLTFENPSQNVADGLLLNNNVNSGKITTTIQTPTLTTLQNCENVMSEPVVPSTNQSTMITGGVNPPISLIPHYVDGTMAYTVKIGENPGSLCQANANLNFQEAVSEGNSESLANQLNSTSNIAPKCVTSLATTVIGSIPDIISSSTTQPIPLLEQNDPSLDHNKVSYIVLPTRNAGEMITTTAKLSEIGPNLTFSDNSENQRKVPSQVRIIPKTAIMSSLSIPSDGNRLTMSGNTQLTTVTTAAPISTAVVNTSLGTTSLDPIVSSTPTGSGMIRVVAKKDFPNSAQGSGVSAAKIIPTKIKSLPEANGSTKIAPADGTQSAANSSVKLPLPNFNSEKPLGSSDNPIQLVQQGQTFHSMQPLSREQLKQIATVLQQRHFDTTKNSKNVLYDAETNTRIIYRVVYPEDCDLRDPRSPSDSPAVQASPSPALASVRGKSGRRGRPPKSAMKPAPIKRVEPEDMVPDMEVNKGDKDERKKQLPRTRSGRLSRPPRHMVKDYKRLHHLDFAEPDLDDSDGGYSDYQISEAEMEDEVRSTNEDLERNEALLSGLSTSKRKISSHFRCPTCQKVYLGHRRMARHFEMYPDHGSIEDLPKPAQPQAVDSSKELPQEAGVNDKGNATAENADGSRVAPLPTVSGEGESGSTPLSAPSATSTPQAPRTIVGGPNGIVRHGGPPYRRRGRRRGPHAYMTPEARSERRLAKLRELVGTCEPREVIEVAGSIVADSLTSWELLLLRAEGLHRTGISTSTARIGTVCQELRSLLKEASNVVGPMLVPISTPESVPATTKLVDNEAKPKKPIRSHRLQIEDERMASMLGVKSGTYLVSESDDQKLLYRTPVRANALDESISLKEEKDDDSVFPENEKIVDMPPPSAEPAAKKMKLDEGNESNKNGENSLLKSDMSGSTGDEWSKEDSRKDDIVDMLSGDMCESSEDREVTSLTLPSASVTSGEVVSAPSPCVALSEVDDDVGEVSASGDHSSVQAVDELVNQHLEEMKIEKELDYTIDPKPAPVTSMSALPENCGGNVTASTIPAAFENLQDHFPSSEAGDTIRAQRMGGKCETQDSQPIPSDSFSSTLGLSEVIDQRVDDSSKLQHGQCMDNVITGDSVTKDLHVDHTSSKVEINFQLPPDRSMNLDLTGSSIDMSLDSNIESGPELDFEALSEEFNRNTQS